MTLSLYAMFSTSMCGPLDRVQVYAVLVHLPQRRELAQLLHFAAQQVCREIDFFLVAEAPERDAHRAVRQLVRAPERAQHVRRLERSRGARRARRHGDVLDRHDQRLPLDEVEAHVEVVRNAPLEVAVHVHLFDVLDRAEQPVAQRAASPKPTIWWVGSVPERKPRSWPPPWICASRRTRGLRRT